jgi:hypothetical protein
MKKASFMASGTRRRPLAIFIGGMLVADLAVDGLGKLTNDTGAASKAKR